ncbi:hypothetical protein NXT3_PC00113 (plasmid) [Sinorhizobium fredii]|uniref:Uncharacterized protein n=1 Tax=Rhizobium fredii TaxID=380 RepID=A0A2L0HCS2_RHIFR|nr:hypothetical protein NXT3_PC00113 [Sinorhizobium fredii]
MKSMSWLSEIRVGSSNPFKALNAGTVSPPELDPGRQPWVHPKYELGRSMGPAIGHGRPEFSNL